MMQQERVEGVTTFQSENQKQKSTLTQRYRKIISQVEAAQKQPEKSHHELLTTSLCTANELFKNVNDPVGAGLDSKLLVATSQLGKQSAKRLKLDSQTFDTDLFLTKLKNYQFNEDTILRNLNNVKPSIHISKLCNKYWSKVPSFSVILGPLATKKNFKKKTLRKTNGGLNQKNAVQTEKIDHKEIQNAGEQSTTNEAKTIYSLLSKVGPMSFFRFFINTESFAQSVENLFYISFLIKEGRVKLYYNEKQELMISTCSVPGNQDYLNGLKAKQHIIELDVESFLDIIEALDINGSIIPNRLSQYSNETVNEHFYEERE